MRETVYAWRLHVLIDDLTLVVSELTTNAVRHAPAADSEPPSKAWLGIAPHWRDDRLRCVRARFHSPSAPPG
ncbi:hypothetical protein [Streptomyces nodosus]|uniref:hypothetical protein n=1 Tax=Streptomyces nodosus TaxID=40318 RepID=UPI00382E8D07